MNINKWNKKLKKSTERLSLNLKEFFKIHNGNLTILLGFTLLNIGVYLFNFKIGFIFTGAVLVFLGKEINKNK